MNDYRHAYVQNRAEELEWDVWEEFIVPLYFDSLEITKQRKTVFIEGGRGCGKTTLLRYLCHRTQFSPKREINPADLAYIGIYLRLDTNFLASLAGDEVSEKVWHSAFEHALACRISLEILDSLRSLNCSPDRQSIYGHLEEIDLSPLRAFDQALPTTNLKELSSYLLAAKDGLSAWINNIDLGGKHPVFLPGVEFAGRLIDQIQAALPYLSKSLFAVFIDEYENLHVYQQQIINGLIKHGQPPLIFNVAMKHNGMLTNRTLGPESIQDIADFRKIDIEERLAKDFDLFCAELLFFRLIEHDSRFVPIVPIRIAELRDPAKATERAQDDKYRKRVIDLAKEFLPRLSERELAQQAFETAAIQSRLRRNIEDGLRAWGSPLTVESFLQEDIPDASLVSGALLSRKKETPDDILREMKLYARGEESRFNSSEWIKNNLVGVLLQLYGAGQRPCPVFAGFDNFVLLAHNSIRHFLELAHQSFQRLDSTVNVTDAIVPIEEQATAVRLASTSFLREIRSCGIYANELHAMVLTLGAAFRAKHHLVTQSEPEINHVQIIGGEKDPQLQLRLKEAVKWSVFFEEPETKKKVLGSKAYEYVLNPIYAGYFQISFRKKRALPIAASVFRKLFDGTIEERNEFVREVAGQTNSQNLHLDFESDL